MPKANQGWNIHGTEGKEIAGSKRRRAGVERQPLTEQTQVDPFVGQQSALTEILLRDFHARDFTGGHLLFDGRVKLLRRKIEAVSEDDPRVQYFPLLIFEPEDEIYALAKKYTLFFWLASGCRHTQYHLSIASGVLASQRQRWRDKLFFPGRTRVWFCAYLG